MAVNCVGKHSSEQDVLWIQLQGCAGKKTVVTNSTERRFETVFILCDVLWGTLVPFFFTIALLLLAATAHAAAHFIQLACLWLTYSDD